MSCNTFFPPLFGSKVFKRISSNCEVGFVLHDRFFVSSPSLPVFAKRLFFTLFSEGAQPEVLRDTILLPSGDRDQIAPGILLIGGCASALTNLKRPTSLRMLPLFGTPSDFLHISGSSRRLLPPLAPRGPPTTEPGFLPHLRNSFFSI